GRTFHHNSYSSGDIVASMICATNREPKEVLSYDPDNRKVVFIPFIRLNPLNRANVYKRRDDFRKVGFLNKLFLSLDENGKDSFDDTDYHQQFTMWLKPRNADHTLTEKYIDCLIRLYGGSKITPSSIYDAYRVFHGRLARENDDGKKLSPMGVKNFNSTFKHVFEVGRDMNNRWKVVPTPKQAYEKGWCYINPDEDGLLNESTIELLKDNLDIIDIQILQDAVLNDNGGKI
ncbi:MAG TPA: hypothetical protein VMH87_07445, partial [Pseudomonadales bacterium]|nr:hypothetical protein [Pseudomonadales bacterium]